MEALGTEYFKLVRPDYGSFYDPSFKWPVAGVIEVKNAVTDGPCGEGLHLAYTMASALKYAKFPFRILRVRPLSLVLGRDADKVRVAKAESLREEPVPEWAKRIEQHIKELPAEMKAIPWFQGGNTKDVIANIKAHLRLLVPFGFKLKFKIKIVTKRTDALTAYAALTAARDAALTAARDAAWDAAWDAARDAAWASAWDAARASARDAARDAAWASAWASARASARDAAWTAARAAAWDAARDAAWASAWDAAGDNSNPFKPLYEVWKSGAWPIGFVDNKFVVYIGSKRRK